MRKEIRLSGSGGQGLQLIGRILAEALGVFEGKNVVQSSSYGGQVRGGSSRSDVLVSSNDEEIDFPEVMSADILLSMTQEAADEYAGMVKPDGLVILDTTFVKEPPETPGRVVQYPFTLETKKHLGTELPTNVVALAVVVCLGKLARKETLLQAISELTPEGKKEINLKALNYGYELVETGAI
jgi:2-oxoglutarate ferredoxin oxidoreductase subunit gamma